MSNQTPGPDHHSRAGLGAHPFFESWAGQAALIVAYYVLLPIGRVVFWLIEHIGPLNRLVFRIMGDLPHVPVGCMCAECQAKRVTPEEKKR